MHENNRIIQLLGIFFLISSLYEGIDEIQAVIINSGFELYNTNIYAPYISTLIVELVIGLLLIMKPQVLTSYLMLERTNDMKSERISILGIASLVIGIVLIVDSLPTLIIQSIGYFPRNSNADVDFLIVGLPLTTLIKEAAKLIFGIGFLMFYRMNFPTSRSRTT